jgi:hypothetical protein
MYDLHWTTCTFMEPIIIIWIRYPKYTQKETQIWAYGQKFNYAFKYFTVNAQISTKIINI